VKGYKDMPRIINTSQFRGNNKRILKELFEGREPYLFIANETSKGKSIIITTPLYFAQLLDEANRVDMAEVVRNMGKQVEDRIVEMYKRISGMRGSNKL
jgi:hypothetical protein